MFAADDTSVLEGAADTDLEDDIEYGDLEFMADVDLEEVQASMSDADFLYGCMVKN